MSEPNKDDDLLGMGEQSDSYVYVDDEGNAIPPEEETSWLMAMGVRGHDSERPADDGAAQSSDVPQPQPMVETQYAEDPAEFEKERKLASDRLQAVLRGDYVQNDGTDDIPAEAVEEVDEGMEFGFSRELTPEDEWILEHIIDRRAIRGAKGGSDYKVFYDDFGNKETGMLSDGRMEYLCKWKWYVEPTWETRDLLEDEGYLREMRAFDDEALKDKTAVVKKWSDIHGAKLNEKVQTVATGPRAPREHAQMVERTFGDDKHIVAITGITRVKLASQFRDSGVQVASFGCCAKQDAINSFLTTYQRLCKTHRPVILFHGTQSTNLYNIAMNGLRVPRSHGDVTNGSRHGMGIYAAPDPQTSICYCSCTGKFGAMFLCVGLVSNSDPNVSVCGDYCVVFRDSSLILPLWLINFEPCFPGSPLPRRRILSPGNLIVAPNISAYYKPLVTKLSPDQGKAMSKLRNKNILNLNKLAKKSGA